MSRIFCSLVAAGHSKVFKGHMEFELEREHNQVPLPIKTPTISIIGTLVGIEMKGVCPIPSLKNFAVDDKSNQF